MVLYNFKHVSAHVALYMFIRVFLNQHNELIGIVSLINSLRSIIYQEYSCACEFISYSCRLAVNDLNCFGISNKTTTNLRTMGKPRKSDGLPLQVHNFLQENAENGMLLITAVDNTKEIQVGAG